MRGNPVDKDADAFLVATVDEVHEVLGRPEARRGREISGDLISPRTRVRMLHDGQQLDVRVAHVLHVRDQLAGKFPIAQRLIMRTTQERSQVDFVHRDRPSEPVCAAPLFDPLLIGPCIGIEIGDDGG